MKQSRRLRRSTGLLRCARNDGTRKSRLTKLQVHRSHSTRHCEPTGEALQAPAPCALCLAHPGEGRDPATPASPNILRVPNASESFVSFVPSCDTKAAFEFTRSHEEEAASSPPESSRRKPGSTNTGVAERPPPERPPSPRRRPGSSPTGTKRSPDAGLRRHDDQRVAGPQKRLTMFPLCSTKRVAGEIRPRPSGRAFPIPCAPKRIHAAPRPSQRGRPFIRPSETPAL